MALRDRRIDDFFEYGTHFMYRILDSKKTTRFQFSIPGLREIHRNLKQQKNFKSHEPFFRKSSFCTFSCINPGFGRLWDEKMFFKRMFLAKKISNFMQRLKSGILALLNPCIKFEFFLAKSILLKHYENANKKKYS